MGLFDDKLKKYCRKCGSRLSYCRDCGDEIHFCKDEKTSTYVSSFHMCSEQPIYHLSYNDENKYCSKCGKSLPKTYHCRLCGKKIYPIHECSSDMWGPRLSGDNEHICY